MIATVLRVAPTMRLTLITFLICCGTGAGAQESSVVQGEIVDLPCYMVNGEGAEYQACVELGTQLKGVPMGILTDSEAVFLLVNESADPDALEAAKGLAGQRAELTGTMVSRRGVASFIVESAREL